MANLAAIGPAGRSRATEAACLSNMMKWGQILQVYTAANNGYFHSRQIGTAYGYSRLWLYTYEPYYIDHSMLCCPAANNPYRDYDTFATWGGPNYEWSQFGSWDPDDPQYAPNPPYYGSYGWNRYITNMLGAEDDNPRYWRRTTVQGADNVPVIVDCMYVNLSCNDDSPPPEYEGDLSVGAGLGLAAVNRHDGGVNVCFMDFSARKVGLKELWTLKGNRLFDTCNEYTICYYGGNEHQCAMFWDDQAPWMSEFPEY